MPRRFRQLVALLVALVSNTAAPVWAHNERVHQLITDYAYLVALAMSQFPPPSGTQPPALLTELAALLTEHPELGAFYVAAHAAVPKLRALPSGLPEEHKPCIDVGLIPLVHLKANAMLDWLLPANLSLEQRPLSAVIYPVTANYNAENVACGIDKHYEPGGALTAINPGTGPTSPPTPIDLFTSRDHTGVTLGYWAAGPDRELEDWVFRSTTTKEVQNPAVLAAIAVGTTGLVSLSCVLACGVFPLACPVCPAVAIGAAVEVIDEISSLDASAMKRTEFVGLGHFIDVQPTPPSQMLFDDVPGKFSEHAGPDGNPDVFEELVIALYEWLGWHVRSDLSLGTTNYEIAVSGQQGEDDFASDSVNRNALDWETATGGHLQYTPVDNLALFGWLEFKAKHGSQSKEEAAEATRRLGWPLHALGDATVPMHVVGASGYGHRPYEDSIDMKWGELVFSNDVNQSSRLVRTIVLRAFQWRQFIQQWRADHGGTTDVPVRDLITALADQTHSKSVGPPGLFNTKASLLYQFSSESDAKAAYNTPALTQWQRDTVVDAIAATLAFFISATEVIP
jgi:hypothetical protein